MQCSSFVSSGKVLGLTFLALMSCCLFQTINAQSFERGYIVLNSNDTLFGSVKDRNDGALFKKIRFKNERGIVKRYTAEDILSYKSGIHTYESLWYAEESHFFKFNYYSRPGYGHKVFLKVLVKGRLTCYAKEFVYDDNDFFDQFELFLRDGDDSMARATQGIFGLKKKRLIDYFWDCPSLVSKIHNGTITKTLDVVAYYNEICDTNINP